MYRVARAALTAAFIVGICPALSAQSLSPEQSKVLDDILSNPQTRQELEARLKLSPKAGGSAAQAKSKTAAQKAAPAKEDASADSPKQPDAVTVLIHNNARKAPLDREYSPCAGFTFILRQDWKDLGNAYGAACPDSPDKAQGAQISYANDMAAKNRIVTINGTAAVLYNTITGDVPAPLPYAVSLGAFATVNDVSNSAASQSAANVDTLQYGGLVNLGFTNSVGGNYFMLRGGSTDDYIKNTTAGTAVLDWTPVVAPLYIHYPFHFSSFGIPIIARFDPDLVGRFDSATGHSQVLAFNNMKNSFRVGPEMGLRILPDPGYVSGPLSRLTGLIGYDIWYEGYSRKELTWFTSSVTYNIDDAGNFGVTGTYNSGSAVNTGTWTHIYTIGLSGKM